MNIGDTQTMRVPHSDPRESDGWVAAPRFCPRFGQTWAPTPSLWAELPRRCPPWMVDSHGMYGLNAARNSSRERRMQSTSPGFPSLLTRASGADMPSTGAKPCSMMIF